MEMIFVNRIFLTPFHISTTSTQVLYNAEVPTVADVYPRTICAGSGTGTIQVSGTGFAYITKVELIRDCSCE